MKSIRLYLIIALLSTITLVNFLAAIRGYQKSMATAQELMDAQLSDTAEMIYTLSGNTSRLKHDHAERLSFQIWSANKELLGHSANVYESPITSFEEGFRDENFSGYRWRVLSRYYADEKRWVLVAERIDIRVRLANDIIVQSVLPILLSFPFIAGLVWLVVSNGLSQLTKLAKEVRTKRADDLSQLKIQNPPNELAAVVGSINDLLDRLQRSVSRERRFSADAAHELRTPLAAVKVHAHNMITAHPEFASELQEFERDLGRLSHLIEQMVELYRTSPEHYQASMKLLNLTPIVQEVISDVYDELEKNEQSIDLQAVDARIYADKSSLKLLIGNLLLNASRYSGRGAKIVVRTEQGNSGVRLSITDDGPGIPDKNLSRVMDRFYRIGGDRHSGTSVGCGLGLSIVQHIADLHQARVVLKNRPDTSGLEAIVEFPLELKVPVLAGDFQDD